MPEPVTGVKVDDHVMVRILDSIISCGRPCRRTELGMSARVNYTTLQKYLLIAQQNNLVSVWTTGDGTKLVGITDIGRQAHKDLSKWNLDAKNMRRPGTAVVQIMPSPGPDNRPDAQRKRTHPRHRRS
jgi:predicted transcriptional regulator